MGYLEALNIVQMTVTPNMCQNPGYMQYTGY